MEHLVRPFIAVFSDVPDFRHAQGKRHQLPKVLTLVTLAMISQQNTLGQIAAWVLGPWARLGDSPTTSPAA